MKRAILAVAAVAAICPLHAEEPGWSTMWHGYAFLDVNRQGGPAAQRDFEAENHFMVMSGRPLGAGRLSLVGTFTLEPATFPPEGVPELFQRGETFDGVLLVDRQHPHDLIAQVAATWERPLGSGRSLQIYVAPRGEPAVGPEAYPHRLSASMLPIAPLAHHNQDSTHISSDVVTAGVTLGPLTIEGSGFHGREPDENRWDVEQGRPDSYAGRVTWKAMPSLSFQVSSCFRRHPESLEEGDQTRATASATYMKTTAGGFVAGTLIFGKNQTPEGAEWGNGIEGLWRFAGANYLTGRVESVDRDLFELVNKRQRPAGVAPENVRVGAATIGYARSLPLLREASTDLGADVTLYAFDARLDAVYGDRPVSFHAWLKLGFGSPASKGHEHHQM